MQIRGSEVGEYRLSVLNGMGQVVRQKVAGKTGEILSTWFDVSDLPGGAYVVRVQSGKGAWIGKVMKEWAVDPLMIHL